jgi:Ankyrin repeats (3 copies)/GRAM domain
MNDFENESQALSKEPDDGECDDNSDDALKNVMDWFQLDSGSGQTELHRLAAAGDEDGIRELVERARQESKRDLPLASSADEKQESQASRGNNDNENNEKDNDNKNDEIESNGVLERLLNFADTSGWTSLHVAAAGHQYRACLALMEAGQRYLAVGAKNCEGSTALHYLVRRPQQQSEESSGYAETLAMMLRCGADIDQTNNLGEAPLHSACLKGNRDAVKSLLRAGADSNARTGAGQTPLQYAVQANQPEIAKTLCEYGADPRDGTIELASQYRMPDDIVELLRQRGDELRECEHTVAQVDSSSADKFVRRFEPLPGERVHAGFICACSTNTEVLVRQGRLYVSNMRLCFYGGLLRGYRAIVLLDDIRGIRPENTAFIVPNAVTVFTKRCVYYFTSFMSRQAAYDMMVTLWRQSCRASVCTLSNSRYTAASVESPSAPRHASSSASGGGGDLLQASKPPPAHRAAVPPIIGSTATGDYFGVDDSAVGLRLRRNMSPSSEVIDADNNGAFNMSASMPAVHRRTSLDLVGESGSHDESLLSPASERWRHTKRRRRRRRRRRRADAARAAAAAAAAEQAEQAAAAEAAALAEREAIKREAAEREAAAERAEQEALEQRRRREQRAQEERDAHARQARQEHRMGIALAVVVGLVALWLSSALFFGSSDDAQSPDAIGNSIESAVQQLLAERERIDWQQAHKQWHREMTNYFDIVSNVHHIQDELDQFHAN